MSAFFRDTTPTHDAAVCADHGAMATQPHCDDVRRKRWATAVGLLALALMVMAALGKCWEFGFLAIDDPDNFLENPYLRPLELERLRVIWTEPYWGLYTPVTSTVWALEMFVAEDEQSGQIDARWFHGVSLALHIVAVWLVWLVLSRLLGRRDTAWLGAALFAVHPIQTEAVCWASETKGLLAGVFGFAAIWYYGRFATATDAAPQGSLRGVEHGGSVARWTKTWHYAVATLLYVVALLSKPNAAALVLMAGVIDVGVFRRRWRHVARGLFPWLVLAAGLMVVTRDAQGGEKVAAVVPLGQRPLVAADTIVFYLGKIVWPVKLGPDYGRTPVAVVESHAGQVGLAIAVGLVAVAALMPGRRWWLVAFGLLVAGVAPVLGFVPFAFQDHSTVADRYVYLAMLGPAAAVGHVAGLAMRRGTFARAMVLTGSVVGLMLLMVQGRWQSDVWRDDRHWAQRAVEVYPASLAGNEVLAQLADAEGNHREAMQRRRRQAERHATSPLAWVYLGRALLREGEVNEAVRCFRRALALHPDSPAVEQSLARALVRQGEPRAAIDHFRRALRRSGRNPGDDDLWIHLAEAHVRLGEEERALEVLQRAVLRNPFSAALYNRMGRILHRLGRFDEAATAFQAAIRLAGDSAVARNNLGVVYLKQGDIAEAAEQFRLAVAADPQHTESMKNWCLALDRLGRRDEAIEVCRRVLEHDPHWREGHYLLASRLVMHPDAAVRGSPRTLEAARSLCRETNYREPQALDILAAALAESGRIDEAVRVAEQVVERYRRHGRSAQARAAAARLEQYRQTRRASGHTVDQQTIDTPAGGSRDAENER